MKRRILVARRGKSAIGAAASTPTGTIAASSSSMPRKVLTRATATVDDAGAGPFRVEPEGLTGQFANLYFTRLGMLSPVAREAAASAWGGPPTWVKALDAPANGETVAVVGTLFAELSNKPDIDKGLEVAEAAHGGAYVGGEEGTDSYCLEDESGRLQLGGVDKLVSSRGLRLVTGAVIAVRGVVDQDGVLTVGDVVFPGAPPAAPSAASAAAEDDAAGTHAPPRRTTSTSRWCLGFALGRGTRLRRHTAATLPRHCRDTAATLPRHSPETRRRHVGEALAEPRPCSSTSAARRRSAAPANACTSDTS